MNPHFRDSEKQILPHPVKILAIGVAIFVAGFAILKAAEVLYFRDQKIKVRIFLSAPEEKTEA